ncbi:hypothetical protein CR513_45537, partial [Mucuna pruriens]
MSVSPSNILSASAIVAHSIPITTNLSIIFSGPSLIDSSNISSILPDSTSVQTQSVIASADEFKVSSTFLPLMISRITIPKLYTSLLSSILWCQITIRANNPCGDMSLALTTPSKRQLVTKVAIRHEIINQKPPLTFQIITCNATTPKSKKIPVLYFAYDIHFIAELFIPFTLQIKNFLNCKQSTIRKSPFVDNPITTLANQIALTKASTTPETAPNNEKTSFVTFPLLFDDPFVTALEGCGRSSMQLVVLRSVVPNGLATPAAYNTA